jgi:acyl-CoA thioesterase FadM
VNKLFRLLWLALRSHWAPACPPLGPCRTELRVWPNDLDVFMHVNNGVYFSLCDLGRVDLLLRSGAFGLAAGRKRTFLVAGETIQLRRPMRVFERFAITTRVLGWDDKGFFVEQRITLPPDERDPGGQVVAIAVVEGRVFERGRGQVPPVEVLAAYGLSPESPPLPGWVERWKDDQRALRTAAREAVLPA